MQQHLDSTLRVPVPILHMAESQHMGKCLALYSDTAKTYSFGIALAITLPVGVGTIALPLFLMPWSYYLLALLLLFLVIFLPMKRAEIIQRHNQIALYDEGFIFFHKGSAIPYRWDEIQSIQRGAPGSESHTSINIDTITVRANKKIFKLNPKMTAHARAAICDHIEHGFVAERLPIIIDHYNAGKEIAFGTPPHSLWISQAGFRDDTERLPWAMVEKAKVENTLITIRKEGRTSDWYSKLTYVVTNAALLKAFFSYLQRNR